MANNNAPANLPQFLKVHAEIIPDFNGEESELHFFLASIDSIVEHFFDAGNPNNFQNVVIFRTIISKLKDAAREVINISGATTIAEIRAELVRNFSDPRNENSLIFDLNNLRQSNAETAHEFHDRVRKLLNTISNYLSIHEANADVRRFKQNLYNQQGLQVFLAGLRNPHGLMVRTRGPRTMLEAINFIKNEENIRHVQNPVPSTSNNNNNTKKFNAQKPFNNFSQKSIFPQQHIVPRQFNNFPLRHNFPQSNNQMRNFNSQQASLSNPINLQPNQNVPQRRFPTNQQVFGKPQNYWQQKPNEKQERPSPMSTTSARPPFQNYNNQSSTPRWTSEELYNIEEAEIDNQEQEYEYDDQVGNNDVEQGPDFHPEEIINPEI